MTRAERLAVLLRETLPHLPAKLRKRVAEAIDSPAHRPRVIDRALVRRLTGKMTVVAIAEKLGCTRQAVHAVQREHREESD